MRCGIELLGIPEGDQRPSVADYVAVIGSRGAAIAAGASLVLATLMICG